MEVTKIIVFGHKRKNSRKKLLGLTSDFWYSKKIGQAFSFGFVLLVFIPPLYQFIADMASPKIDLFLVKPMTIFFWDTY